MMNTRTTTSKENLTLDIMKMVCAIFVVVSHLPQILPTEEMDFYYNQWFFRFCVPFFFISSGYYFFRTKSKLRMLQRVFWLFALSYVLYIPIIWRTRENFGSIFSLIRWNLFFGHGHLWYLNAALQGMLALYLIEKIPPLQKLFQKFGLPLSVFLLFTGALLDEHYRVIGGGLISKAGDFLSAFGGPRNVIFMGFPLLALGGGLAQYETQLKKIPSVLLVAGWIVFRLLAFLECRYLLLRLGMDISCDLSFFGIWPAFFLFVLSFRIRMPITEYVGKQLRKLSEYVYVLHPLMTEVITGCLILPPIGLWVLTVLMFCIIYLLLEKQFVTGK